MSEIKAVFYSTPESISRFTENVYLLYRKLERHQFIENVSKNEKRDKQERVYIDGC